MKTRIVSLILLLALPVLAGGNTLVVKEVRGGGIIVFDGNDFTARLTGLSIPDKDHKLGKVIHDFIKKAVQGKTVRVSTWTTNNLASGIVHELDGLPFVTIDFGEEWARNLNEILLLKGYAKVDEKYLPDEKKTDYIMLQMKAENEKVGLWGKE